MSLPELLAAVRKLPRDEKLRLMHELLDEVVQTPEEKVAATLGIKPGTSFDVWFPVSNCPKAAFALSKLLEEQKV